jgi:Ni,Fe-hydrogenase III small subunit
MLILEYCRRVQAQLCYPCSWSIAIETWAHDLTLMRLAVDLAEHGRDAEALAIAGEVARRWDMQL